MPEHTFKPNEAASIDTHIREDNPAVNYGGNVQLWVGFTAAADNHDTLIKFDISLIPPGSIIEAATLSLYLEAQAGGAGSLGTCYITRILAGNFDWTEGGCTWNTKDGANPWAGVVGCETRGVDIAGSDLWSGDPSRALAAYDDFELDPIDFQAFLDVGNYGFKYWSGLRAGGALRYVRYASAADANPAQHPTLYVRWREPAIRLVRYSIDVWDPERRIMDSQGEIVTPDRVDEDEWIRLIGAGLPSSIVYDNLIEDPRVSYIESVSYRMGTDTVHIKANKESMMQSFLKRLGGVTS